MKISFIGAGAIAEAILSGLLEKKLVRPEDVAMVNRSNHQRLEELRERYALRSVEEQRRTLLDADVIILAVKPNQADEMLTTWGARFHKGHLLISVMAGITTAHIESYLSEPIPVIRTMPNTSCTIGMSATAISPGRWSTDKELAMACRIFRAVGLVVTVEENMMDAVTGLAGSGPAYFYYMVEAMEEAGVHVGLPRDIARKLVKQTILGAAHMLQESEKEPAQLRAEITSQGGTTEAGVQVMQTYKFFQGVMAAVDRAVKRSGELGKVFCRYH